MVEFMITNTGGSLLRHIFHFELGLLWSYHCYH